MHGPLLPLIRKILLRSLLVLAALTAIVYAGDDLWARHEGRPTEEVKVYRMYAAMNRWNEVEYSVGPTEMETCVDALMPHFGYKPCWYLKRHTYEQIGNP
jgi:hypothetical protein